MIVRYNMNCYAQFRTERGLQQYRTNVHGVTYLTIGGEAER